MKAGAGNPNHDGRGKFASAPDKGGASGGEIRETRIDAHPALERALGIEPGKIFADCAALAKKHPEIFNSSQEAKAYVDHVMSRPTHVLPGNEADHKLVVREGAPDEHKAAALEIELKGGKYRVKSLHTLTDSQLHQREKAAGPGAKLGVSRVDPPLQAKTPSRLLSESRDTPPVALEPILARMRSVNRLADIAAIEDDALFSKALAELIETP